MLFRSGFREKFFGVALGRVSVDISQQSNGRPKANRRRTVTRRLTQRVAQVLPPAAFLFGQGQITVLYSLLRFFCESVRGGSTALVFKVHFSDLQRLKKKLTF